MHERAESVTDTLLFAAEGDVVDIFGSAYLRVFDSQTGQEACIEDVEASFGFRGRSSGPCVTGCE